MRDRAKRQASCQVSVKTGAVLPMAEYLTTGVWMITTDKRLRFSITCHDGQEPTERVIDSPMGVLNLSMTCTATNDFLSLPAYYQFDSMTRIDDKFLMELQTHNITSLDIWGPVHTSLPHYNFLEIPSKLKDIERIPIEPFIAELQELETIFTESSLPSWAFILIGVGSALLIGAGVAIYLYKRQRRNQKYNCRERERKRDEGL